MKRIFTLLLFIAFFISGNLNAQQPLKTINKKKAGISQNLKPTVKQAAYFHVSRPLRDIIEDNKFNNTTKPFEYREEEYNQFIIHPRINKLNEKDPLSVIQQNFNKSKASQTLVEDANFDGTPAIDGVAPPDTQGDVNSSYYMQCTNGHTTIYNLDGTVAKASFPNSDFWNGTPYNSSNDGDAIILWDEDAGRWLVSQFAVPSGDGKYYELIAISTSSDPLGSYYQYAFQYTNFPDYPKFAVWPDGYYCGFNYFDQNNNNSYLGSLASVYERDKMLTGDPAARVITYGPYSSDWAVFPADADAFPTSGTPCYFMSDDVGSTSGNTDIYIYEFHTDWSNPGNSSFGNNGAPSQTLTAAPYDLFSSGTEVPQSGTSNKLDLLHYRIMYRPYFRHFSTYDDIVMTRTVNDGGVAAVRWYEFRNSGSGWSIYQQGTYNPGDGLWRWMPSIAMNANGDIALGYSVSSSGMHPGLRGVARYATDPLGTMTTNEYNMFTGSGSEDASGLSRWGDYSMVSIDPSDNYSFWFTTEYTTGGWNWRTRITHFHLPILTPPSVSNVSPASFYEDRGKQLTITGTSLTSCTFDIGGITGTVVSNDGSTAVVTFSAGNYTNGTLTVTNAGGNDTYSVTVNTRNTIPVVSGAGVTSDNHPTIQSAVDGLYAWYGTTAFNAGDLAGTKTIEVSAATYTEGVTLNSSLNPTAANPLIIQPTTGAAVIVDATGNNYGFDLSTVDYVTLTGFTVHSADLDNIYAQGNNVSISYNKTYGSVGGSGIKVQTGTPFTVTNNLSYSNYNHGIEINSSNNTIKNNTCDDNGHSITGPQILTYSFSGPSVSIPDNGCPSTVAEAAINVPANVTITKVRVLNMNITHTYDGDLDIYLIHPDATSVSLCLSRGGSGDNFTNTNFDDAAGTAISAGSAPFTSTYIPETALSALNTKLSAGNWLLRVCDGAGVDVGTIDSWQLEITYSANEQLGAGLYLGSVTGNTVENNIFSAKTGDNSYYSLQSPGNSVTSDYNTYYTTNTNLFDYNGTQDNSGPIGANDLTSDPLFVGSGDYHIFSTNDSYHAGEWPPSTATAGTWTTDASDSPALDTGNPADSYSNEPQSGNRINQGCYGNTVQASKTTSAVTYTWDGSTDNNWFDATNWTPAQVPTVSDNVTIANVTNQPTINNGIGNIAQCNNITIDNGASLTIDPNGYMTVSGAITNNGGNAGLVINSDATGTGSLIQNTSGGVDATVKCYLASSSRQWHMVSSPITAAPFTVFPSTSNLYYYDESTADYWTGTTYGSSSVSGWTAPAGNMTVGKGYVFNYFASTLTYTGQLNDNSSSAAIAVPYNNHGANDPDGNSWNNSDGWSLIGNPYTSAIDWDDASVAHAAANLNDAVYTYEDGSLHNYTSYVGGVGTNGGTRYIPAMQGFFVKSDNTETGGTLNIGAAARVHNTQSYWKGNTPNNFLRLQIAGNGYTDETVIRLNSNATYDSDNGLDAYKLFTWDVNVPQIYTVTGNGNTEFSINTVPDFAQGTIEIPLKVAQTGDNYKIGITEFNFSDVSVYLKDNLKNTTTEIGLNDVFELNTDASDNDNRFELVFEKSTSGIILAKNTSVTIYPNPTKGQFFLTVGNTSDYTVRITNVTGQMVYNNNFCGNTSKMLDLSNQSSGIYFVNIQFSDKSSVTKKVVIQ